MPLADASLLGHSFGRLRGTLEGPILGPHDTRSLLGPLQGPIRGPAPLGVSKCGYRGLTALLLSGVEMVIPPADASA